MDALRASHEEETAYDENSHRDTANRWARPLPTYSSRSSQFINPTHLPSIQTQTNDQQVMDSSLAHRWQKSQIKPRDSNEESVAKNGRWTNRNKTEQTLPPSRRSDDGHGSETSSLSMIDEVELDHWPSPGAALDDEEAALTRDDNQYHPGRWKKRTDVEGRTASRLRASKLGQKIADRSVMKTLFLNSLLVASWYLFSLSISLASLCLGLFRSMTNKTAV